MSTKSRLTTRYTARWSVAVILCLPMLCGAAASGEWEQFDKLIADDAVAHDNFGWSVAISGSVAIAGTPRAKVSGIELVGAAYLFDITTGDQNHKLTADDGGTGDGFGTSVAISGNIAVIGAPGHNYEAGAAYLFDVTTGEQLRKLTADDAHHEDLFGRAVAISGNIVIVGSFEDDDLGQSSGSAYLFDVTTGNQLHKLTAEDGAEWDGFGLSVAIDGNLAVVGSPNDDDAGDTSGSAYLFDVSTGQQLYKLTADDAAADDHFGGSVAISGNTAIVGAPGDYDDTTTFGAAYLFGAATGEQLHKLTADDAAVKDMLGYCVAINGNITLAGAAGDYDPYLDLGAAYVFDVTTGQQLQKLTTDDAEQGDRFAHSLAMSGDDAIIGAYFDDDSGDNSGSAYLFSYTPPCPSDLNGDGVVDVIDLLQVLGDWGECP